MNATYVNDLCNVSTRLKSILFADDASCFIEGRGSTDLAGMCVQLNPFLIDENLIDECLLDECT